MTSIYKITIDKNVILSINYLLLAFGFIRYGTSLGYRGVSRLKINGKYVARIGFKKKKYYLGRFDTLEEAVKARQKAEDELYKPFLEWYDENFKQKK